MDYSLLLIFFKKSVWNDDDNETGGRGSQNKGRKTMSIYIKHLPNGEQEIEIEEVDNNFGPGGNQDDDDDMVNMERD